jgi:hypothetical protein
MAVAFEIEGESKESWLKREEEFNFCLAPYTLVATEKKEEGEWLICARATDDVYIARWGREQYLERLSRYNLPGIWSREGGLGSDDIHKNILPCSVYLRHCVLGAKSMSDDCLQSFLDETYLVDRTTTIREYLDIHPEIMQTLPPESVRGRYSG